MQQKPVKNYPYWLIAALLLAFTVTSCSPNVTPEIETPTITPTLPPLPTQTATPLPEFTPTPTQPVGLEIEADDLAGVVVRFAHPWIGQAAEVLDNVAKEFSSSNPWGIQVEVYPHGGETALISALQGFLESGQMPGLIAVHPYLLSALGGDFEPVDLSDYYDDLDWGFDVESQADLHTVFFEPFTYDDQIIALPFAPQATVLFYNTSWGEALGHSDLPDDLNSFRMQSCDAAFFNWRDDNPDTDGTGGWKINLDPTVLASWYYAFGGVIPNDEIPSFSNEAGQDAFSYLWDVKTQGCIWFARQPDPYTYFANRYALLYAGQLDQVPIQMRWMEALGSEDEWQVIGFPGPVGETILVDGPGLIITPDSMEQELAAWLFAKHLLEPEVQAQLVRTLFSLPVRESSFDLLGDFEEDYPQWSQGASMLDSAKALPVSQGWGMAKWVLQDAVFRLLQAETNQVAIFLEQLDEMILDLSRVSP
jgi:multiple sugar transport system substrate-binding protein